MKATLLESITVKGESKWQREFEMESGRDEEKKERERRERENEGIAETLLWKTTCTGNAVANGRKWTVVHGEYGE